LINILCEVNSLFCVIFFFFFKQKTAYEIGLGIPAEPLFRSLHRNFPVLYGNLPPREISMKDVFRSGDSSKKFKIAEGQWYRYARSEERRVGKECRSRWWPYC